MTDIVRMPGSEVDDSVEMAEPGELPCEAKSEQEEGKEAPAEETKSDDKSGSPAGDGDQKPP